MQQSPLPRAILAGLLAMLLPTFLPMFLAGPMALANEPAAPTQVPAGEDKAPALAQPAPNLVQGETQHDVAYRIGKDIRCPVCQGMSIAESPSPMAQDMMGRVRAMLTEGRTGADIRAYFVERYGVWVLLDPPKEGFLLLVWCVPPIVLLGAGALALRHMRRLRLGKSKSATAAGASATAARSAGSGPSTTAATATGTAPDAGAEAYLQAIRDEVRQ